MSRRFFRHGELPLVLLALVDQRPMHGYELMSELARLFGPAYRPSPGTVYPAVDALQTEGLIDGTDEGGRTRYATTTAGQHALDERARAVAAIELRTGVRLTGAEQLEPALARFAARVASLTGQVDVDAVMAILERTAVEIESLRGLAKEQAR
jgi:DNA-binding PadR family transcriptional regulator